MPIPRNFLHCLCSVLLLLTLLAAPVEAQTKKERLGLRLKDAATRFETVALGDNSFIPPSILQKATGIIVMSQWKAGFIFGGKGGYGVAMVRDPRTGQWSPPAFYLGGEGSFGLQAGVQKLSMVLLIMNEEGMRVLSDPRVRVGVDAAATAGPHSVEGEAKMGAGTPILVYSTSQGLFAGAAFEGGALVPDEPSNTAFYGGRDLTTPDILFGKKVPFPAEARALVEIIEKYAKPR